MAPQYAWPFFRGAFMQVRLPLAVVKAGYGELLFGSAGGVQRSDTETSFDSILTLQNLDSD